MDLTATLPWPPDLAWQWLREIVLIPPDTGETICLQTGLSVRYQTTQLYKAQAVCSGADGGHPTATTALVRLAAPPAQTLATYRTVLTDLLAGILTFLLRPKPVHGKPAGGAYSVLVVPGYTHPWGSAAEPGVPAGLATQCRGIGGGARPDCGEPHFPDPIGSNKTPRSLSTIHTWPGPVAVCASWPSRRGRPA